MICRSYSIFLYLITDFSKLVLSMTVSEAKNASFVGEIIKAVYQVDLSNQTKIISMFQLDEQYREQLNQRTNKTRFKRQGKFTEAAQMGQTKVFRLQLQLAKNFLVSNPVGVPHPLHPIAPTIFISLLKSKLIAYFSPDITEPPKVRN